jgi:hypothetical protein
VVAIDIHSIRYIELSHSVVAGPSAASCITDDKLGAPSPVLLEMDDNVDDDDTMDLPAYRPTATESTRLSNGSLTQIRNVVAEKKMILPYEGRPTNGSVIVVEDADFD